MPPTRTRPRLTSLAAATVLLTGALTGCSISQDKKPSAQESPSPAPTPTATETVTASPTPTVTTSPTQSPTQSPTGAASPSAAPTLQDALLSAAEMPKLSPTSPWAEGRTGTIRSDPFGVCQKFDLLSIGATDAVERDFSSHGDTAGQQVADFPDAQNAVRASKVLEAWHRDCAQRVRGQNVKVTSISDVPVTKGRGSWYLVSSRRQGTGHFETFGVVLSGPRMTLLRMDHDGQDHTYPPGQDPMQLAVKAAATKLG